MRTKPEILVVVSVICRMIAVNTQMGSRVMVNANVKVRFFSQVLLEVLACPPQLLL